MRYLYILYNALCRRFNSKVQRNKALVIKAFLLFFLFGSAQSYAQIIIAADNANNYSTGNPWNHNSNRGFGFGPWIITTGGTAGAFLGDPAGISGMTNPSFGLYANPGGTNNYVNADRSFAHPLPVGATLSIQWGVNWDSNHAEGNKGINIYSGGTGTTPLININQRNSPAITINGQPMFNVHGTIAMTIHFERSASNQLRVHATGRNGTEVYNQTFNISVAPDAIRFYAARMYNDAAQRQPYFNNLQIAFPANTTFSEDLTVSGIIISPNSTLNLGNRTLTIGNGGFFRNNGTFNAQTGTVIFSGQTQVQGSNPSVFHHAVVSGMNVEFGSPATAESTIAAGGILEIRSGNIVNHAPVLSSNSTLRYSTGNEYNRVIEWRNPWNVHITGTNTRLNLNVNAFANSITIGGNLIIDSGSSLTVDDGNDQWDFNINGDLTLNGTLTLSNTPGRDLFIKGSFNRPSGTFIHHQREVIFNGNSIQNINHHTTFSFLRINNPGGTVMLGSDIVVNNRMAVDSLSFINMRAFIVSGNGTFNLAANGGLGIGHLAGITTTGASGNIQVAGTRAFSANGIFHYLGIGNQLSGNALPTDPGAKTIILELNSDSNTFHINTTARVQISSGGRLEIRRGILVEPVVSGRHIDGEGNLIMRGGTYRFERVTNIDGQTFPRLTGTYTLTGGTVALTGETTSYAAFQRLRGGTTYHNVLIAGNSGNGGFKMHSSRITVNGSFTITGNNIFDARNNTLDGPGSLIMDSGLLRISILNATVPQLTGVYNLTGGTVELYGTNATQHQTLRGGRTYNNIEINSIASNVWGNEANVNIGESITVNGTLTVNAPSVFQTAHNFVVSGPGTFNLRPFAYLRYGNAHGITPAPVNAGNIQTKVRIFSKGAGYVLIGANNMVTGLGLPDTVAQFIVNKSSNPATLSRSITVTGGTPPMLEGALILNRGNLITNQHQVSIEPHTPGSLVEGPNNAGFLNSFIIGNIRRHVDIANPGNYFFPVGATIGTSPQLQLAQFVFSNPNGTASGPDTRGFLTATFIAEPGGNFILPDPKPTLHGTPLHERLNTGYWSFLPVPHTHPAHFRATLTLTSRGHTNGGSNPAFHAIITRANSTANWQFPEPGQHSGMTQSGTWSNPISATVSNINTFGHYAIARSVDSPLPVELLTFTAQSWNDFVSLMWATATEINNDFFTIQRSHDGFNFHDIGRVKGKGFSSRIARYTFEDAAPISGISYYRLKQTDYDGKWEYVGLLSIRHGTGNASGGLSVTGPFYANGHAWITISHSNPDESVHITIIDIKGRVLHREVTKQGVYSIPHHLPKGKLIGIVHCNRWRTQVYFVNP